MAPVDINENAVGSAAEGLIDAGHQALAIRCNVVDEAEVAGMVKQTVSTFGRLDAAYNNAGVQSPAVETVAVARYVHQHHEAPITIKVAFGGQSGIGASGRTRAPLSTLPTEMII